TYPLMRGTAPLLVAAASAPLLGETLAGGQWLGVGLICVGIWTIGAAGYFSSAQGSRSAKATVLALINAGVIATYTLIDGAGARVSGAPATYTAWIFLITAAPMLTMGVIQRRRLVWPALRQRW